MTKLDLLTAIVKYKETNNWDELCNAIDSYDATLRLDLQVAELENKSEAKKCFSCGVESDAGNQIFLCDICMQERLIF